MTNGRRSELGTRRRPALASITGLAATLVLVAGPLVVVGAGGSAAAAAGASKPTDELLTTQDAIQAGFTKLVQPAEISTSTGTAGCPNDAQEAFEDSTSTTGLVSEAYFCSSRSAASTVMKEVRGSGSSIGGLSVPSNLGSTAVARRNGTSNFGIFWQRGSVVEVTALDTNLTRSGSAASSSSGKTLTPHLRSVLVGAAKKQNAHYESPPASTTSAAQSAVDKTAQSAGCPLSPTAALHKKLWAGAPPGTIDTSKQYTATVVTDVGTFVITLRSDQAGETVNNFVFLADHQFFNCVTFHRVIPGFVDQTGDPTGTGSGGPGYTIRDEFPPKATNPAQQYPLGSVAMANTGQPNTGGSQWFVVTGSQGESLPNSYTLFGQVSSGMDVLQAINAQGTSSGTPSVIHRILKVTITPAPG